MPTLVPSITGTFTAEETAAFDRDGYVIARGIADDAVCEQMREVIRDQLARRVEPIEYEADLRYPGAPPDREAAGGATARRLKQAHARGAVFTEWVQHPLITGRVGQFLDSPLYCPLAHHNCVMTKHPDFSSETGWHQDFRYWSFAERNLVTVWLALGEEHAENGGLRVIPGTHRELFGPEQFDADLFLRPELPQNRDWIDSAIDVELSAGDVLFFHCRTFHAAGPNRTDQTKLSVVFTYRGAGNLPVSGTRSASLPELLIHT